MMLRTASGSSSEPSLVDSATSEKITVTVLRVREGDLASVNTGPSARGEADLPSPVLPQFGT